MFPLLNEMYVKGGYSTDEYSLPDVVVPIQDGQKAIIKIIMQHHDFHLPPTWDMEANII